MSSSSSLIPSTFYGFINRPSSTHSSTTITKFPQSRSHNTQQQHQNTHSSQRNQHPLHLKKNSLTNKNKIDTIIVKNKNKVINVNNNNHKSSHLYPSSTLNPSLSSIVTNHPLSNDINNAIYSTIINQLQSSSPSTSLSIPSPFIYKPPRTCSNISRSSSSSLTSSIFSIHQSVKINTRIKDIINPPTFDISPTYEPTSIDHSLNVKIPTFATPPLSIKVTEKESTFEMIDGTTQTLSSTSDHTKTPPPPPTLSLSCSSSSLPPLSCSSCLINQSNSRSIRSISLKKKNIIKGQLRSRPLLSVNHTHISSSPSNEFFSTTHERIVSINHDGLNLSVIDNLLRSSLEIDKTIQNSSEIKELTSSLLINHEPLPPNKKVAKQVLFDEFDDSLMFVINSKSRCNVNESIDKDGSLIRVILNSDDHDDGKNIRHVEMINSNNEREIENSNSRSFHGISLTDINDLDKMVSEDNIEYVDVVNDDRWDEIDRALEALQSEINQFN